MKLLCAPCDEQMKLERREGPEEGSLSLSFHCPKCRHETVIFTNPLETQLVKSLDVEVCPMGEASAPEPARLIREGLAERRPEAFAPPAGEDEIPWDPAAAARIERVPVFIRGMVKKSIVNFARKQGYGEITESVMDEARGSMGM